MTDVVTDGDAKPLSDKTSAEHTTANTANKVETKEPINQELYICLFTRSRHQSEGSAARAVRLPMRFQGPLLPEIDCFFLYKCSMSASLPFPSGGANKQLVLTRDASKQIDRQ